MMLGISLVILIISVIAHEVAHGYAADSLGDPTARLAGRLTLNPLPHIDLMGSVVIPGLLIFTGAPILFGWAKPVPYNPYNLRNRRWGEAFVAVAGSATNIVLAIIFGLMVRFASDLGLPDSAASLAAMIAFVNLFLALFNMIPFPPLDGFTTLRSLLPWSLSERLQGFEYRMKEYGMATIIIFIFVFFYILSEPFSRFVLSLFTFITGG